MTTLEELNDIDWELADLMMAFETEDKSWIGKLEELERYKGREELKHASSYSRSTYGFIKVSCRTWCAICFMLTGLLRVMT